MGFGFDDADAELVEEAALPPESGLDTIMDPWIDSAPCTPVVVLSACSSSSASSSSLTPEKLQKWNMLSQDDAPSAGDVKRRRLSIKTSSQKINNSLSSSPAVIPVLPEIDTPGDLDEPDAHDMLPISPKVTAVLQDTPQDMFIFPLQQFWAAMTNRKRYLWCFEKVRLFWSSLTSTKEKYGDANYRGIRQFFGALSKAEKTKVGMLFCQTCFAPDYVEQAVTHAFGWNTKDTKTYGKTLLLTYNGPWGLNSCEGSDTVLLSTLTVDEVVALLRKDAATQKLCEELKEFSEGLKDHLMCSDVSCCIEICTNTLKEQLVVKCHIHVWLRCCKKICVTDPTKLAFQAQSPNLSGMMCGIVRDTRQSSFQGMLYTSSLKVGSVFSYATREPFTGYLVQPSWLMNMLQGQKITFDTCREAVLKTCQNVGRYLKDLEVVEQNYRMKEIDEEVARVQRVLALRRRPFLSLPVVLKWQQQYLEDDFRYRFLVLEGPSQHGKTQFVRSLVPEDEILELSCSGGVPVDFRSFKRHKHKLVLFDEIEAQQVLALRKAFQAGASPVQMGQSQTGMYTYTVFLYRVMFVLCSNTWTESLNKLKPGDVSWIEANQIYIKIDKHLFL